MWGRWNTYADGNRYCNSDEHSYSNTYGQSVGLAYTDTDSGFSLVISQAYGGGGGTPALTWRTL